MLKGLRKIGLPEEMADSLIYIFWTIRDAHHKINPEALGEVDLMMLNVACHQFYCSLRFLYVRPV
jgi:hypothetical protein